MCEAHDPRRQPLLVPVQLADLHFGTQFAGQRVDPASAMVLPSSGERMPLVTTPTCALPMCTQSPWLHRLVRVDLEADKLAPWMLLALDQRSRPMKSSVLVLSGTVNPIPSLERIGLRIEFIIGKMRPASMRTMSSASSPIGRMPCFCPASHTASKTAAASLGWQKIS